VTASQGEKCTYCITPAMRRGAGALMEARAPNKEASREQRKKAQSETLDDSQVRQSFHLHVDFSLLTEYEYAFPFACRLLIADCM
jgi:hypothetical protein